MSESETKKVFGYKVFDANWKCNDFQYAVGKTYKMSGPIELCERGFHFCLKPADCFNYKSFDPKNKCAEIEATIIAESEDKCVTNEITIVREISWNEMITLCNIGSSNSGIRNSGNQNSGDWNSGYRNSGNRNSGNQNSGDQNSGYWNSGNQNSGDQNSGNWNSGNQNSGDWNSGYRNSGNRNSGNQNSGDWNSGNRNSGNRNSGNRNSGDWNSGNRNSGYLNSQSDLMFVFNKRCAKDRWDAASRPDFLYHLQIDPQTKRLNWKHAWNQYFEDRMMIRQLPNFTAKAFYDVSGIDVNRPETWLDCEETIFWQMFDEAKEFD